MKKIVSLLMVVLMAFAFMPCSAFAENNEALVTPVIPTQIIFDTRMDTIPT